MTSGTVGSKLHGKRFVLVGGPGGVGKTTLAAAIGLRLAEQGHRTLVLTVDPAKRLAQALGFEHFSFELEQVKVEGKPELQLFASMLDSRRYFDRIISRYATSEAQREKIFANPIYRTMVDQLGGTHEYAAMERLAEFAEDPRFDRIVVDTPPAPNAIDLLQAPQRLADFMDNAVMKWFQSSSGGPLKIFQRGTRLAMKAVEKIFGSDFIGAFSTLMDDIEGMQGKFKKTSLEVLELLRSERLAFLLVTYPSEARLEESVSFVETLRQEHIALSGVVLNRVETSPPALPDPLPTMTAEQSEGLFAWERYQRAIGECHQAWVTRFHEKLPGVPHQSLRALEKPPGDLATLRALGEEVLC